MPDKIFLDTNILAYAHDSQAGLKQKKATEWIERAWQEKSGVLSLQVLQELYVILTGKLKEHLPLKVAKEILEQYGYWEIVPLEVENVLDAIDIHQKYRISFWDALIVQAALIGDCSTLLSEDLQHGQKIKGLLIQNPFA